MINKKVTNSKVFKSAISKADDVIKNTRRSAPNTRPSGRILHKNAGNPGKVVNDVNWSFAGGKPNATNRDTAQGWSFYGGRKPDPLNREAQRQAQRNVPHDLIVSGKNTPAYNPRTSARSYVDADYTMVEDTKASRVKDFFKNNKRDILGGSAIAGVSLGIGVMLGDDDD